MLEKVSQLLSRAPSITELDLSAYSHGELAQLLPRLAEFHNLEELRINGAGLHVLPSTFCALGHLRVLELNANRLTSLPPELGNLATLTALELNDNELASLPPTLGHLAELTALGLINNRLVELPPEIGQLRNLESLGLSNNSLASLPDEIGQLDNLASLGLANNELVELPLSIAQLSRLRDLDVSGNQLQGLPPTLGNLDSLRSLAVGSNSLRGLPESIGQLESLRDLTATTNQLAELPETIGNLENLESLWLEENQLSTLPNSICRLAHLQHLALEGNQLTRLPRELEKLSSLQLLTLNGNAIESAPHGIAQLPQLRVLSLAGNMALGRSLDSFNDFASVASLQSLDLSGLGMASIPEWVFDLNQLKHLVLDDNEIDQVNADVSNLSCLRRLHLDNNALLELPAELSTLSQLTRLSVRSNHLRTLGADLTELQHLKHLDVGHNPELQSITTELEALAGALSDQVAPPLQTLGLTNTKLKAIPRALRSLSQLRSIWLDDNELTQLDFATLPPSLQRLRADGNSIEALSGVNHARALQELSLRDNSLARIPSSIGDLAELRILDLGGNQIDALPKRIGELASLQVLKLEHNLLTALPGISWPTHLRELKLDDNKLARIAPELFRLGLEVSFSGNSPLSSVRTRMWVNWLNRKRPENGRLGDARPAEKSFADLPRPASGFPVISVQRVSLRRIRCFDELDFDLAGDGTSVLFGDNATGKTTILKAIALALLGPELANQVEPRPWTYLRRGSARGSIDLTCHLQVHPGDKPLEFVLGIEINDGERGFRARAGRRRNAAPRIDWLRGRTDLHGGFLCGYGATRYVDTDESRPVAEDPNPVRDRILSLFEPGRPLMDVWVLERLIAGDLAGLRRRPDRELDPALRYAIKQALADSLPNVEFSELKELAVFGSTLDVGDLSEGYSTHLGLVAHLIRHALEVRGWTGDPTGISGVLLIDEVEQHLHPIWKRRVLEDLRSVFPAMQIITTTHSATVARFGGKVAIRSLQRDQDTVVLRTGRGDLDDVSGWSAEEIERDLMDVSQAEPALYEKQEREFHEALDRRDVDGAVRAYRALVRRVNPSSQLLSLLRIQLASLGVRGADL